MVKEREKEEMKDIAVMLSEMDEAQRGTVKVYMDGFISGIQIERERKQKEKELQEA